jgi:DNA-binding transcriptional LysR family regulator
MTQRVQEFLDLFPEVQIQLLLANEELDLTMRQADCAIRLRQPQQPDLIQRRLFTVHLHVYAAPSYLNRHGKPNTVDDLARHRLVTFGEPVPSFLKDLNSLQTFGMPEGTRRTASLQINDLMSIRRAVKSGAGIAMLPDYMVDKDAGLVQLLPEMEVPSFDTFFVYPEAMKNQAKLKAFRDFLFSKARGWAY